MMQLQSNACEDTCASPWELSNGRNIHSKSDNDAATLTCELTCGHCSFKP